MHYMKVIMDADCLIKLTKAGLKELVCKAFAVSIPRRVKEEVVDSGRAKDLPEIKQALRNYRRAQRELERQALYGIRALSARIRHEKQTRRLPS